MSPSDLKDLIANADALLAWAEGRLEWTRPETKVAVRHVRDAAYWKRPVGTIIIAEGLFNKLSNLKQVVTEHPSIAGSLVVTDNKGRKFDVFKHDDKKWYAATHEPNPNKWGRDVIPGQKSQEDAFLALDKKVGGGKAPGKGKTPHEPGKPAHVSNADKATKLNAAKRRASAAGERARKAERAKARSTKFNAAKRQATTAERKEANKHGAIPTGSITKDEPPQQRIRNSDGTTRLVDVGSDSHSRAVANLASFKPDDTRTPEEKRQISFYGDSKKESKPKAGIVTLPPEEHKAVVTFADKVEDAAYKQTHRADWSDSDFWKDYPTPKTASPAVNAAVRNVVKMGRISVRKQRKQWEVTRPGAPMRLGNRHGEASRKSEGDFRAAVEDLQRLIGEQTRREKMNEDRAPMPKAKAPSTSKKLPPVLQTSLSGTVAGEPYNLETTDGWTFLKKPTVRTVDSRVRGKTTARKHITVTVMNDKGEERTTTVIRHGKGAFSTDKSTQVHGSLNEALRAGLESSVKPNELANGDAKVNLTAPKGWTFGKLNSGIDPSNPGGYLIAGSVHNEDDDLVFGVRRTADGKYETRGKTFTDINKALTESMNTVIRENAGPSKPRKKAPSKAKPLTRRRSRV